MHAWTHASAALRTCFLLPACLQVPAYEPGIGPGHYDPDPLGEKATASLAVQPGEVHHAITYARDPTRESACFVSPERWVRGRG